MFIIEYWRSVSEIYLQKIDKKLMQNQIAEEISKYQWKDESGEHTLQNIATRKKHMRDVKMINQLLCDMFENDEVTSKNAQHLLYKVTHTDSKTKNVAIKQMIYSVVQNIIDKNGKDENDN